MLTWAKLADVLGQASRLLLAEWGCLPAAYNQVCIAADEARCDHWCRQLAKNPGEPLPAPADLRPWILARLLSATGDATLHAELQDQPCPPILTPAVLEQYLVGDWHAVLKSRWQQLDNLGESLAE